MKSHKEGAEVVLGVAQDLPRENGTTPLDRIRLAMGYMDIKVTLADLANKTGLSKKTVQNLVASLEQRGEVTEAGKQGTAELLTFTGGFDPAHHVDGHGPHGDVGHEATTDGREGNGGTSHSRSHSLGILGMGNDPKRSIRAIKFRGRAKPVPREWIVEACIPRGHATSFHDAGG